MNDLMGASQSTSFTLIDTSHRSDCLVFLAVGYFLYYFLSKHDGRCTTCLHLQLWFKRGVRDRISSATEGFYFVFSSFMGYMTPSETVVVQCIDVSFH